MRRIAEHCHFFPSDVASTGLVTATSTIRSEQFRNRRSIMHFRLGLAFPTGSPMRFRLDLVVGMPEESPASQRQRRLRRAAFWWQNFLGEAVISRRPVCAPGSNFLAALRRTWFMRTEQNRPQWPSLRPCPGTQRSDATILRPTCSEIPAILLIGGRPKGLPHPLA